MGFDDERLINMSSDELDDVIIAYMEMFPDIQIKDVHMFFDEIQLIKDWEYFVLRVYKSYFKDISTDSYLEQDKARLKTAFEDFIHTSAFPEIVLATSKSEQLKLLHGYFDTMILRDLTEHYRISNTSVVRYLIKRIMDNLTKPTSIDAIYNDIKSQGLKVSKDDLYLWADYACRIFMFIRIPRYSRSVGKERKLLDKYYCMDNGLRAAVLMPQSNDHGKYLENTILLYLKRNLLPSDKISYYQGYTECDFVLQREDRVVQLIQATWSMTDAETREREIKGLLEASSATGCDNLLILTHDEEGILTKDGKQILVVPTWKWVLGKA